MVASSASSQVISQCGKICSGAWVAEMLSCTRMAGMVSIKKGNAMKIPWNTTEFIEDIEKKQWTYLCFVWCNNLDVSLLGTAYRSRIGPLCWSFIAFCFSFHSFHSFPVSIISRRWALKKEPSQSSEQRGKRPGRLFKPKKNKSSGEDIKGQRCFQDCCCYSSDNLLEVVESLRCREISFFVAMLKNVSDLTGWTKPVNDELKWW